GRRLFLSNDSRLLAAVLDRTGTSPPAGDLTYAAGFRPVRERSSYERVMAALDFTSSAGPNGAPEFFSGNIASISRVLSNVGEVRVLEEQKANTTTQTVLYHMQQ